jgi:eukaryotic-like serine/threonine-protein kinase
MFTIITPAGAKKGNLTPDATLPTITTGGHPRSTDPDGGNGPAIRRADQLLADAPRSGPKSLRSRAYPVPEWDRYEPGEFIGEGGMGRVYKARDPRLRRYVALKFLRSEGPEQVRRFFREARTQASIEHPHICKVYEVGTVEDMPYIAMAYIEGKSLKEAKQAMSLEQKVKAMAHVCAALHAAHRTGLIHRDIKPSNIMVERTEEGGFHPYILDFGLAREIAAPVETAVDVIEGTPAYMPPEQVSGSSLDRRSDIYSLGATLYELLCGRPPFVGNSTLETLNDLMFTEPTPPRKIAPEVPVDLETITLKCIEKEPSRRYDSAKALAEELQRYLEGEPIQARRASFAYVALKKARKHKALMGVSASALLAVLLAAGMGVRASVAAARQAELAEQLGQDVKEIEFLMRYAYSQPVHDIRHDKERVRARMQRIQARMAETGALSEGPGRYALGRGHLALHEPEKALSHLRAAWKAGYRKPEVEYALGQVLGELYKAGLDETQRISDKDERLKRQRALEKEYLEPALQHLRGRERGDQLDSPAYAEGLLAFYSKQYDEALRKASEAMDQSLWRYEVKKLEGDARAALGNEKRDQGRSEEALVDYTRAAEVYREGREMARSDATIHEAECEMWVQVMELEAGRGTNPKASLDNALRACDEALKVNPESGNATREKSWAYGRWGVYLGEQKRDPRAALEKSIELGRQALRIGPEDPDIYDTIGNSYHIIADYLLLHGMDPREALKHGTESFERALEIHPTFAWGWNDVGGIHFATGDYESGRGIDPRASFDRSIESFTSAIALNPQYQYPYGNRALAYVRKALYELRSGIDPRPSLDQAEASCREAIENNPSIVLNHEALGDAYQLRAHYELYQGVDLEGSARKAVEAYSAALSINATAFWSHMGIALVSRIQALHRMASGADPSSAIERASAAQAKMAEINQDEAETNQVKAEVALLSARWAAHRRDKQAGRRFEEAEQGILQAILANEMSFEAFAVAADVGRWKALWQIQQKKPPRETIAAGLAMADRGLSVNPNAASLMEVKGMLLLLRARAERDPILRREAAAEGQALVDEALRRNPFLRWQHASMTAELDGELPQQ